MTELWWQPDMPTKPTTRSNRPKAARKSGISRLPYFLLVLLLGFSTPTSVVLAASSSPATTKSNNDQWLAFRDSNDATAQQPQQQDRFRIAAHTLQDSLKHQSRPCNWVVPGKAHRHLKAVQEREAAKAKTRATKQQQQQLRRRRQQQQQSSKSITPGSFSHALRVGLAGGLAGAAGTFVLYPLDAAKTLRQSNPSLYPNVQSALVGLLTRPKPSHAAVSTPRLLGSWHLARAYKGVAPSTLGAIPSSALYFGAYEAMKGLLKRSIAAHQQRQQNNNNNNQEDQTTTATNSNVLDATFLGRLSVHALSAASGNVLSSAVFVPKEAIKQQMQYMGHAHIGRAAAELCRSRGVAGLYAGYKATLLRNIPTAAIRFAVYEELKHRWLSRQARTTADGEAAKAVFNPGLFAAGAMAGILASAFMTPIDVLKTRIATGTCPVDLPGCAQHVLRENGLGALYAGAGSRMLASGAFSAIGFGVFEAAKKWLSVSEAPPHVAAPKKQKGKRSNNFTVRQRRLDHALIDRQR